MSRVRDTGTCVNFAFRAAEDRFACSTRSILTQKALGKALNVNQPAVAKLERRTDMYVSNLRAYIEAVGGRLNITAQFPQGNVTITNFSDSRKPSRAPSEQAP